MSQDQTVQALSQLLADTYTLYLKTLNYHWNVTGPQFVALHQLFEEHYLELAGAGDEVAERIRGLGAKAPGSYARFGELTSLQEGTGDEPAETMIANLRDDHRTLSATANKVLKVAEAANDDVSVDLATQRQTFHEKSAWMLSALLN